MILWASRRCWPYVQHECEVTLNLLERLCRDEESGMMYNPPAGTVSWSYDPLASQDLLLLDNPGEASSSEGCASTAPAVASNLSRIGRFTRMKTKFTELMLELETNDDGMVFVEQWLDETMQHY
jgi:hypothetical protein